MTKINRKPNAFVARIAAGDPGNQAAGFATIAITRNIFTAAVLRAGTLLKPAAFVRAALTNGFGRRVFAARNGRVTKSGMPKMKIKLRVEL